MVDAQRRLRSVRICSASPATATIVPQACNVVAEPDGRCPPAGWADAERSRCQVDVRIGIVQTPKELEVELADDADREKILADIEAALTGSDEGVLWLTDRRGRRVAVPVAKVAYVEVGAPSPDRRVGFGAP